MSHTAWLILLGAWAISVASPGPDFVAVLRSGATYGRRDALVVAAGVATGITGWIVLALTGLAALIAAHESVYLVVRLGGAGFLMAYGLSIVWHARGATTTVPEVAVRRGSRSLWAAYRLGLMTNLANPKALAFFGALFASLLPAHTTGGLRIGVTTVMAGMALAWFGVMAFVAGSGPVADLYQRAQRGIDRVLGAVFVGLGGLLLTH